MLNLHEIDELVLQAGTKGLPLHASSILLKEARTAGWRLHHDLQMPAAILRRSALENNANWMKRFVESLKGVVLCPHGKTTMAPQLMDRQLRGGAWGITCATMAHLRCYRRFGVQRIIFANQVTAATDAAWLANERRNHPELELYVFVDSIEQVELLASASNSTPLLRPLFVLLEVGFAGGRTGVQSVEAAKTLARFIRQREGVVLSGVATFEGIVPGGSDPGMEPNVERLFDDVECIAKELDKEGLFDAPGDIILSAGGSRFFDIAAARLHAIHLGRKTLIVLRSGCYLSHDAHHYEIAFNRMLKRSAVRPVPGRLENALEVWANIQSRPEPSFAYANLGKRDISYDYDLPRVVKFRSAGASVDVSPMPDIHVSKLSDQHAHLNILASSPLKFGDRIGFGVSHPCTTFDKWRFLFEVNDNDVVVDVIATFF